MAEEDTSGLDDDLFLAADLTEYFGTSPGISALGEADQVVVAQLKYSTRHPAKAWTAARLGARSGTERPHSVISRLADTFKGFSAKNDRLTVLGKLRISLVSNQPASEILLRALALSKAFLQTQGVMTLVQSRIVLAAMQAEAQRENATCSPEEVTVLQDEIRRLQDASGLSSTEFTDFLRVLDFNDCGTQDRFLQLLKLRQELGNIIDGDVDQSLLKLYEQVENQALPRSAPVILDRENILAALGVRHEEDLFPAQAKLLLPGHIIQTPAPSELAKVVVNAPSRKIVAHGIAGIGKTTLVQQLHTHLPPGSEVFIYDSYGEGNYRTSKDERHSDRRALTQLANEMATRLGSHFMVWPSDRVPDLRRRFNYRLKQAARSVTGLLVLVVDAADNSVFAASESGQDCFVFGLWELDLPDNVRLLMTARSDHRARSLRYPADAELYPIQPFDLNASGEHLRSAVAGATVEQCATFHARTFGNPRLQSYLLDQIKAGIALADVLNGPRKNLNDLFEERWDAAVHEFDSDGQDKLSFLSCLAAPVSVPILEAAWASDKDRVQRVCAALRPGAIFENDVLGYRDEDFETFIHDKLDPAKRKASHASIASSLARIADNNPYAAAQLARHYQMGELYDELIDLALTRLIPDCIGDEVLRLSVVRDRLRRSLEMANRTDRRGDVIRLLLLSGEIGQSEDAVYEMVRSKPELAITFGDPETVAKTYLDDESDEDYGLAQFRCAAMLSRYPETRSRALAHAKLGDGWLRNWSRASSEGQRQRSVKSEMLAADAEAAFRLKGAEAAIERVSYWVPLEFVLSACWQLAKSIAADVPVDLQRKIWAEQRIHPLVAGVFLVELWRAGNAPPVDLAQAVGERILSYVRLRGVRHLPNDFGGQNRLYLNTLSVDLCEALASLGADRSLIKAFGSVFSISMPDYAPDDFTGLASLGRPLRMRTLMAAIEGQGVDIKSLLPERLAEKGKDYEKSQEREKYLSCLKRAAPVIEWRAKNLLQPRDVADMTQEFKNLLDQYGGPRYNTTPDLHFRAWAIWALEGLLYSRGKDEALIQSLIDKVAERMPGSAPGEWKDLAAILIVDSRYVDLGLGLVAQAADRFMETANPARDRWNFLSDCAEVVAPHDHKLAHNFFQAAVDAAYGFDNNCVQLLKYQLILTESVAIGLEDDQKREVAIRLLRLAKALDPFTSDPDPALPVSQTLAVATALHPDAGAAALIDWDARGFFYLHRGIVPFLKSAMRVGLVAPEQALALGRLLGDQRSPSEHFINVLNQVSRLPGDDARKTFIRILPAMGSWLQRDCPLDDRAEAGRSLIAWIRERRLEGLPGVQDIQSVADFSAAMAAEKRANEEKAKSGTSSPRRTSRKKEEGSQLNIDEILDAVPRPLHEHMDKAYAAIQNEHSYNEKPWKDFFDRVRPSLFGQTRAEYLSSLVQLPFSRWDIKHLVTEIAHCLDAWKRDNVVVRWKRDGLRLLLERQLPSLLGYTYHPTQYLNVIRPFLPESPNDLWEMMIHSVVENLDKLGIWQTYVLANELTASLPEADRVSVLYWSLNRTEQDLKDESALPGLSQVGTVSGGMFVPQLIWTLLGHPDKRERWRVMHAVRMLERDFQVPTVNALTTLDSANVTPEFVPEGAIFYWMSARLFLVVTLSRLAEEYPEAVRGSLSYLKDRALDNEFPHALIRDAAATGALSLMRAFPEDLEEKDKTRLHSVLNPDLHLPSGEEKWGKNAGADTDEEENGQRLKFDDLDTIPYWFQPLGSLFGISAKEICRRAEAWICDKWGRTRADFERDKSWPYQWPNHSLWYNRHGSIPTFETMRNYLTYHAWMVVAGELADEARKSDGLATEQEDGWRDWLYYKHLHNPYWISDLRQPTPHEPDLWREMPDKSARTTVVPVDFDQALKLKKIGQKNYLQAEGMTHIVSYGFRGKVEVRSALVSTPTSPALMRALQFIEDPYRYHIPYAGDEEDERNEGAAWTDDFELKGLWAYKDDESSFDDDDKSRRRVSTALLRPGSELVTYFGLTSDKLGQKFFSSTRGGQLVSFLERWSDDPNEPQVYSMFSEGLRLWIEIDLLLEFLRTAGRSLIIDVEIKRSEEKSFERDTGAYEPPKHRIYLLHPDGAIETVDGRSRLGQEV